MAARSGRSRHSSRSPSIRKTTPNESTWPHTTLSNQLIGLRTATAAAALTDHRPGEVADDEVGQDRRHLDQVADATDRVPDDPDEPQDVEVAGRVVMEEVAVVEAARAMIGEVPRPEPEGVEVDLEAGSRKEAG